MPAAERNLKETFYEQKTPYAFDLGREYELAQQLGSSYRDFFISQAHYYAKESYGKVPKAEYEHLIEEGPDASVRLKFGPQGAYAEDSYMEPATDLGFPAWYRKRAYADVLWTKNLQKKLGGVSEGDMFFDLSPTEFGVSYEERKKWGFGVHSFVRIHKIVTENGQKKLVSRAVRNYLDLPEQEELFEALSGEKSHGELLGQVAKLSEHVSLGHIDKLIADLYEQTPENRRLRSPEDTITRSDLEMNKHLSERDFWLRRIYMLMQNGASEGLVLREFRGWENSIKDAVAGREKTQVIQSEQSMQYYMGLVYEPGASSCGFGSGFGKKKPGRISGGMDYRSMTTNEDESYGFDQPGPCVSCGEDVLCGPCKLCESCDRRAKNGETLSKFSKIDSKDVKNEASGEEKTAQNEG